jgi:hypothetical protein
MRIILSNEKRIPERDESNVAHGGSHGDMAYIPPIFVLVLVLVLVIDARV